MFMRALCKARDPSDAARRFLGVLRLFGELAPTPDGGHSLALNVLLAPDAVCDVTMAISLSFARVFS